MLRDAKVVDATLVAVVATGAQIVPAVAALPSARHGQRLVVRAGYYCRVDDPVRVLEAGCWDVRVDLLNHLLGDAHLQMLGAREDASTNPEVSQRVLARTLARDRLDPPVVPGMDIRLVNVSLAVQFDAVTVPGQRESYEDDETSRPDHDRFGDEPGRDDDAFRDPYRDEEN